MVINPQLSKTSLQCPFRVVIFSVCVCTKILKHYIPIVNFNSAVTKNKLHNLLPGISRYISSTMYLASFKVALFHLCRGYFSSLVSVWKNRGLKRFNAYVDQESRAMYIFCGGGGGGGHSFTNFCHSQDVVKRPECIVMFTVYAKFAPFGSTHPASVIERCNTRYCLWWPINFNLLHLCLYCKSNPGV